MQKLIMVPVQYLRFRSIQFQIQYVMVKHTEYILGIIVYKMYKNEFQMMNKDVLFYWDVYFEMIYLILRSTGGSPKQPQNSDVCVPMYVSLNGQ